MPKLEKLEKSRDLLKTKIQKNTSVAEKTSEDLKKTRSLRKRVKRIQRKLRMRTLRMAKAASSKGSASS